MFLKVKLLVEDDYSALAADEEGIQGATATSENLQPVYYSPLFYPFSCIECVLGAPEDTAAHDNGGDAQVSVSITESVDTTVDEGVVATESDLENAQAQVNNTIQSTTVAVEAPLPFLITESPTSPWV